MSVVLLGAPSYATVEGGLKMFFSAFLEGLTGSFLSLLIQTLIVLLFGGGAEM